MITIYLDHNVIDGFDKGDTAYINPLLIGKGVLPIISMASVDEIFRGGDATRSRSNIESLKKLGVRYIHSDPDDSHMVINELDYNNMHDNWLKIQSDIGQLNDSHYLFMSTLFRGNVQESIKDIDKAVCDEITWIKNNNDRFSNAQNYMKEVLSNPQKHRALSYQLLHLKAQLPFKSKEINNIPNSTVFWTCVDMLKNSIDPNLQFLGGFVENEISSAKTIVSQIEVVLFWLNFFEYYPDDLRKISKVRSNISDARHATYAIGCKGMLTLDKNFAKRAAAAMSALEIKTEVGTDANLLLHQIACLAK
jgi:hypothetical protein